MRLLDAKFKYTPSMSTNIVSTWKKFGYKPTTEAERLARQRRTRNEATQGARSASITQLNSAKRKLRALTVAPRKAAVAGETS